MDVTVGQTVMLDAAGSSDPNGRGLQYRWFHYAEAGSADGNLAGVTLTGAESSRVTVKADGACRPMWIPGLVPCQGSGTAHIVLAVTNEGELPVTSYRRVILRVHAAGADATNQKP